MSPLLGIQRAVWEPLTNSWLAIGQISSFLHPYSFFIWTTPHHSLDTWCAGTIPLSYKRETSIFSTWKPHQSVHIGSQEWTFIPTLQFWTSQTTLSGPSHYTSSKHTMRGLDLSTCGKFTRNILVSFSVNVSWHWMASLWFQLLTCMFRRVRCNFLSCNVYFSGYI